MDTAAGQSDDAVAGVDAASIDQVVCFDNGDTEAGEVIAAIWIKPRHLSSFPPQQGTAAESAARGDAFHHRGHGVR